MKKSMNQIEIETDKECVKIMQFDDSRQENDTIILTCEQIPLLIDWLKEARNGK